MKSNHIYLLSFKTRGTSLSHTDNKFNQMVYQIQYGCDDTANNAGVLNTPNASATSASVTGGKIYKNFYKYNSNSSATDGNFFGNWYTITIPIVSDSFNVEEDLSTWDYLSMNFWLSTQSRKGQGNFDFDDIQVLDLGPMANGGFDYTAGSSYLKNGAGASTDTHGIGWIFDSGIQNWGTTTGSSAYTFLQGGSRLPTEQTDDKYGMLYGQYTSDALMYKYVPMLAGEKYEIKGYVRGQKADGTDIMTKGRARLVVDYTGETIDKEIYDVSTLGTNGIIYGDWVEFEGGYNMNAPMTVTVDLTNIGLIEGKTKTAGIMPRTPKVIVDFDEEWEGNVNAPNTTAHTVYMDGFTIKRFASSNYPTVTANSAAMDLDGNVTVDYTFSTQDNVAEATDVSVYRLVSNGRYYGTFYDKDAIVAPKEAIELESLSLEIVPVTATGYIGETATVNIEMPEIPAVIELVVDGDGVTVFSDTDIEGAQLIYVSYDANGKMIDWEVCEPINIYADVPEPYAPSDLTAGATTVAMLWTDFTETYKPLTAAVSW